MSAETTTDRDGAPHQVGARLQAFREARRLSVRKTALGAGVSASFVSQLERGKCNASIAVLQRLCDVLDIHVSDLFASTEAGVRPVRMATREPLVTREGITKYLITPSSYSPLALYDATFDPTANTGDPYSHAGLIETVVVLDHEVTIQLGDDPHILKAGDSISYASETPHRISNHTNERSRIHWLCAPVLAAGERNESSSDPAPRSP
ncbi:helix-turn-helix domain-containing protein [Streptomyces bathyalis]|uniref:Helix-turn-helix domain-containing protein n=1 Tax=Streptomyces bathyalis TaxID=2710756 RepID=A0A7T1TC31_9ACTN|nr:XRE family transcriptional regulator [Streptomyces bathyalis]QPP10185.1 helix-turn-helix domain-containing protein [Streptomyces bathyalis]